MVRQREVRFTLKGGSEGLRSWREGSMAVSTSAGRVARSVPAPGTSMTMWSVSGDLGFPAACFSWAMGLT